jgi:hypothetical protein
MECFGGWGKREPGEARGEEGPAGRAQHGWGQHRREGVGARARKDQARGSSMGALCTRFTLVKVNATKHEGDTYIAHVKIKSSPAWPPLYLCRIRHSSSRQLLACQNRYHRRPYTTLKITLLPRNEHVVHSCGTQCWAHNLELWSCRWRRRRYREFASEDILFEDNWP